MISAARRAALALLSLSVIAAACGAPPREVVVSATPLPASSATPQEAPEPPAVVAIADTTVSFAAGGDTTLGDHFEEWFDEQVKSGVRTKEEQMRFAFDEIRAYMTSADIAFVNKEGALSTKGTEAIKQFTFRARPELVGVLLDGGIDVVALANNHAYDYGEEGLLETIAVLGSAGILQCGAGANGEETRTPAVIEKNGVTFGFLGYVAIGKYDHLQKPTGNVYDRSRPGVAACVGDYPCLKAMVIEDVTRVKAQVDVPIVSFHWGVEGEHEPEPYQIDLAHAAVDAGAKLILGHHPHVLQGIEVYDGAVILYSLGNFIFGCNWSPRDKDSMIFRATFTKQGIVSAAVVPIKHSNPPDAYFQPYVLVGEPADELLAKLTAWSFKFPKTIGFLEPYREQAAKIVAAEAARKAAEEAKKNPKKNPKKSSGAKKPPKVPGAKPAATATPAPTNAGG